MSADDELLALRETFFEEADERISDYEFWRSLKNLNNEIFEIANSNEPIPFEMVRWRAILKQARSKRGRV